MGFGVGRFSIARRAFALTALGCAFAIIALPAKKKKEDETQTLQLPKDLPNAVTGETRRLVFLVTPLSAKGRLSQQVRDALKALDHQAESNTVLKIRAFVAGSADLRRVRDLVSDSFNDRRKPLPALSLIQAGGLPLEGAQVVFEAVTESRKDLQTGLAFLSSQPAFSDNPLAPLEPLAQTAVAGLRQAVQASGAAPTDVLRVTCFLSSLEGLDATRKLVDSEYPKAARNYIQTQRAPARAGVACEAVAALRGQSSGRLKMLSPDGLRSQSGASPVALVGTPRVILTGTQMSFGYEEKDAHLAFERLAKALEETGSSTGDIAFAHVYPLSQKIADQVVKLRAAFFDMAHPPAGSLLLFEGLSSVDAGFAIDVVAVKD
jgi:enamine deaminase RidA (YjgF/YER057c/UK114 family)